MPAGFLRRSGISLAYHQMSIHRGLWKWNNVHIHFRGKKYNIKSNGYFIRRYEFDDFLLRRSNVRVIEGYNVRQIEKDGEGYWVIDNQFRAKYLIGAGGTHCPVARALFPESGKPSMRHAGKRIRGEPRRDCSMPRGEGWRTGNIAS